MAQILATGFQRAAKTSRVEVGIGTFLNFASWEAAETGVDLPTTNFGSYDVVRAETFAEGIMGVLGCELKFGGAWDANFRPTANPPGLYPRDDLANVRFTTSRTDGTVWAFTYVRIRSVTNSGEVNGLVLFSVTDAKNQGAFTRP